MKEPTELSSRDPNSGLFRADQPVPLSDYLRELWHRRDFLTRVPIEDLKTENVHMLLGGLWLLLNPILQVAVYFLVFGPLGLRTGRGVDQFLVFLTIGVFEFLSTQRTDTEVARSVVVNMGLVRTIRFPRAALPISYTIGQIFSFFPTLVVMLVIVLAYGNWPTIRWLLIPLAFLLQIMFSLGAGLFVARFNHTYRDLESILPFVFRLLFYVSGVLYSVDSLLGDRQLGEVWHMIFLANPMYCFVTLWRWALIGTHVTLEVWLASLAWSTISLAVGLVVFRSKEVSYGTTG